MSSIDISDDGICVEAFVRQLYFQSTAVLENFICVKDSSPDVFLKLNFNCSLEGRKIYIERKVWFSSRKICYSEKNLLNSSLKSFFMNPVITLIHVC